MSAAGGFVVGVLGLSALEAVSSSSFAPGAIGDGLNAAAAIIRRWADPDVPAIPDLRSKIASSTPIPKLSTPTTPGGSGSSGATGGGGGGQGGGGSWSSFTTPAPAFSTPNPTVST